VRRRAALALAAALVVLLLLPSLPAHAGQRQESVFMDDNLLLYRGPERADATLDELKALGVDRVRVSLHWRAIAPERRATRKPRPLRYPEGHFAPHDHLLRAARVRGIGVLVNVTGGAPLWATGKRGGRHVSLQYKPDPAEFARFVAMLGRRYDGRAHPRITHWSIWNEPNQGALLQPQWEDGRMASPRIYRELVRAGLRGLEASGHGDDVVLLGETAPRGTDRRGLRSSIRPGPFLRELLCLDQDLIPADTLEGCDFGSAGRMDVSGFAHHPYSIVAPPDEPHPNPDDMTLADRDRLTRLLDAAAGAGRIPPELPLWYTEYGYQTLPPDPVRGVTLADHAAWLVKAERMTFDDDRVQAHTQFLMLDDVPRTREPRGSRAYWGTYQSGLRFSDGRRKPAYDAYRLGLDAPPRVPPGRRLRLWGFVRAAPNGDPTSVQLEVKAPGSDAFVPAGPPVQVFDPRGYFEVEPERQQTGTWRLAWRGMRSNAVGVYVG
jgi:hypothetical protein